MFTDWSKVKNSFVLKTLNNVFSFEIVCLGVPFDVKQDLQSLLDKPQGLPAQAYDLQSDDVELNDEIFLKEYLGEKWIQSEEETKS